MTNDNPSITLPPLQFPFGATKASGIPPKLPLSNTNIPINTVNHTQYQPKPRVSSQATSVDTLSAPKSHITNDNGLPEDSQLIKFKRITKRRKLTNNITINEQDNEMYYDWQIYMNDINQISNTINQHTKYQILQL